MKGLLEDGEGAGIAYPSEISAMPAKGFNSNIVIDPAGYLDNAQKKDTTTKNDTKRRKNMQDLEKANNDAASVEQARQDNMRPLVFGGVDNPPGFVATKKVKVSTSSAFWKRLRRIKRQRNRRSIVKVITETTIEEFETQLTKYANNGYKIKYVNIDTKAGNSGSGVRYYAVVHRG